MLGNLLIYALKRCIGFKPLPALVMIDLLICTSVAGAGESMPVQNKKPSIVIGLVIDQMRWDFLNRYQDRYGQDGFKRLLREGFSCSNTFIDYVPTITACGHTGIYTGSVPAIHGIIANSWYDRSLKRSVYCTEDSLVETVGSETRAGKMSPRNMRTTTIGDELRLATNFESRVVGVALKDRGSILPAGHSANAAFWYDFQNGNFITSTYYMQSLPDWTKKFNRKKLVEKYMLQDWHTLYPQQTYSQSTADDKPYEKVFTHEKGAVFPHDLKTLIGKDYNIIHNTPYATTLTLDFARAALEGYDLGKGKATDFLTVSISSTDAIGHKFGPNSIETEDNYLRLDQELGIFFKYLDQRYGPDGYLLFLTADHGVSQSVGFLEENKLPGGSLESPLEHLNESINRRFGIRNGISNFANQQLYLNLQQIAANKADRGAVEEFVIDELKKLNGIADALSSRSLFSATLAEPVKSMFINGFNAKRTGDVMIIMEPGWQIGSKGGAQHGSWNPYDAHIPLIWMGYGIRPGKTERHTEMSDIAVTLAALLKIQAPSGATGKVITEITGFMSNKNPRRKISKTKGGRQITSF